ncbi:blr2846 [Bradyrhizobium diazoefficiens USDA 110]|uniref:Blr2846 protein n=2 Tax=Bradyrhizobium diazoefficiens TaxID=1355477 RepID=Q89RC6_BRADU|nr:hypothetical protein CO678_03665 [Bradyrhizobium diazoefficiens]QBP21670.1 hypothetical protein Bdiaspc4_14715 [Bradyrhizobium diazoefficiens]QHP72104.1 hypothetical protein EI171_35250 [Bradyrhizobium sp. LCT2]BAC48111.1 blr2846 [Bradyrhizobium diazoefficiens USDA 110]
MVIGGINDQQARRMYPRLMILNGPDVSSVGAIVVGAIVVIGVQDWRPLPSRRGPAWDPFRCGERKDRRKAVLQSNVPGQNSFGIKLCPARSNCKLTIIQGRPLTIKISVLKWNAPAT